MYVFFFAFLGRLKRLIVKLLLTGYGYIEDKRASLVLRPVYTGDFCRGNSMQFLSLFCCNFKIARVNHMGFSARFVAAISQGFRTCLKLVATLAWQKLHRVAATKIASSCRDKNRLCRRALTFSPLLEVTVAIVEKKCRFFIKIKLVITIYLALRSHQKSYL